MKFTLQLSLLLASLALSSQTNFKSNVRTVLGLEKNLTASVSAGDIDDDGDVDVIVANGRHWPEQNRVYFNNGKG
ncbi:MAG: hypothetical protein RIF46_06775, partial [Cyclobacteriaceae bacterium]